MSNVHLLCRFFFSFGDFRFRARCIVRLRTHFCWRFGLAWLFVAFWHTFGMDDCQQMFGVRGVNHNDNRMRLTGDTSESESGSRSIFWQQRL